ncbi:2,3-diaminopropionate biosynthesis protein SbnB [Streptomyces spongiicola]|uniref:2,3-diaminopropionate biosynthesis protein SbnB n=1 Tax=Streptomyces spongiicola TaxID=1690221 RepID=A0ABM6V0T4_9ACTN|nr:2,3-diaminopropionate biosynthesis protein SbnB [Streptomyces spongiicola]AWK07597.1 2,3-diaminopropionate biosynthesis protein SbnB [Streptomyces spongiicola]
MRILNRDDVAAALTDREPAVLDAVRAAYLLHGQGRTRVPFSGFLRPPEPAGSRIISLPAYLGGPEPVMGMKWISSFPGNVDGGLQRASSVLVLNDLRTGYPIALLEGSRISASRTAASAALASAALHGACAVRTAALIGCGTINQRVLAFLARVHPELEAVLLHDAVPDRAEVLAAELRVLHPGIAFRTGDAAAALSARTVSVATTDSGYWLDLASHPHRPDGQVILHLSLRDLSTASVLAARNVVDDTEHAVREHTSLHMAEQETGNRDFVHAEIASVLDGSVRPDTAGTTVFSPFGLGILDLAVAREVLGSAIRAGLGTEIGGFAPGSHRVTAAMAEKSA